MLGMRWSWTDLENTPPYVRRYCLDLLNIRRQAEADHAKKQAREVNTR